MAGKGGRVQRTDKVSNRRHGAGKKERNRVAEEHPRKQDQQSQASDQVARETHRRQEQSHQQPQIPIRRPIQQVRVSLLSASCPKEP